MDYHIISQSLKGIMRVAFQGEFGAYSEAGLFEHFGDAGGVAAVRVL